MDDISDAYESAYVTLLNLNKTWVDKQGDFFTDSAVILLAAIIWYLKIYEGGKYCTFPHAIELLCKRYEDIFTILTSYPNWKITCRPLWMRGKAGRRTSCRGRSPRQRYPSRA